MLERIAGLIDHTLLRPDATSLEVDSVARTGKDLRTASVCVNPARVRQVAGLLHGSGVLTCAVVAFPFGMYDVGAAVAEGLAAVNDGAQELDLVAPLHRIADRDMGGLEADLRRVIDGLGGHAVVKVILETAAWDNAQIEQACRAAVTAGADFVKTSTGFHPAGGASVQAVELLAANSEGIGVKASGGIRDLASALAMLDAGATRLGCSATASIVAELDRDRYLTAT